MTRKRSALCSEISVMAKRKLVYTGARDDLGHDLDACKERLIALFLDRN